MLPLSEDEDVADANLFRFPAMTMLDDGPETLADPEDVRACMQCEIGHSAFLCCLEGTTRPRRRMPTPPLPRQD